MCVLFVLGISKNEHSSAVQMTCMNIEDFKCDNIYYNSLLQVPDYYKIIKRGMCYDIIAHKLRNSIYEKFDEFVDDMKLIFSNCYQYHQVSKSVNI